MKQLKLFSIIILVFTLIYSSGSSFLSADSEFDTLPLGPSKYRLEISKIEKDQILQTSENKTVTIDDIIAQNPNADVFIFGEAHDNYDCHAFQRDFIQALVKKYPKLIVGFEFFWHQDDPLLEQWRNNAITQEQLIEKVNWYERGGLNYGYTAMIMDVIKEHQIKTIGLNVPRSVVRTISKKGYDKLTPEQKKLFPTIHIHNPEHEYFIKSVFGVMAVQVPFWFTNIYTAQKAWDVIMAESMLQTLAKKEYKGYKGVIIAGNNHVAYKLGIPFRYKKAVPKANIVTISPILLPKEDEEKDEDEEEHPMMKMLAASMNPTSLFSRGIADYVFSAQQPKYHFFPVLGLSIKEIENKIHVTKVTKKSIAEKCGIRQDDIITSFDGIEIKTAEQFRTLLAQKGWDDSLTLGLIKKIEVKKDVTTEEKKD